MEITFNRTKIVATVGPSSSDEDTLEQLIKQGVDVFRLNFSHGSHPLHRETIRKINLLNAKLGTYVAKLQDLQGPKIRVEQIAPDTFLEEGSQVEILTNAPGDFVGNAEMFSTAYKDLAQDVMPGERLMIDDGKIEMLASQSDGNSLKATVIYGGELKSRKGINLPDTNVTSPSLTEKDLEDLLFGLEEGVDWVALSFVRTAKCVRDLKRIIKEKGKKVKVIAKIEKPEAVRNIDEILKETDGLMIARGDLGVEMKAEDVPMIQKNLIEKCNALGKPVIVATQMLESMIENPRPTRAEVNDVANAVLDGADAVMLSGETAAGKYPLEAVRTMVHTIDSIERQAPHIFNKNMELNNIGSPTFYYDNVVSSACILARVTSAKAITGITRSGYTAQQIAKHRPKAHIFIFTDKPEVIPQLNLIWGVRSFYYDQNKPLEDTLLDFEKMLKEADVLEKGDTFIHTSAMPRGQNLRTNMVKLSLVQ